MSGLPRVIVDTWRGRARAVSIAHGLDRLLDHMEERLDAEALSTEESEHLEELLPLSTGLVGLDHVLGGGLRRGEVAWLQSDLPGHAAAVAHAAARNTPHPCLLDCGDVVASVTWLVAGVSGVPWSGVWDAWMSEAEWTATCAATDALARRDLSLCSVGSVDSLAAVIGDLGPAIVVVAEPARLGRPEDVIDDVVEAAGSAEVAVLITSSEELPEYSVDGRSRVRRVVMSSVSFGGAALLLGPDREELLMFRRVGVEVQTGRVW